MTYRRSEDQASQRWKRGQERVRLAGTPVVLEHGAGFLRRAGAQTAHPQLRACWRLCVRDPPGWGCSGRRQEDRPGALLHRSGVGGRCQQLLPRPPWVSLCAARVERHESHGVLLLRVRDQGVTEAPWPATCGLSFECSFHHGKRPGPHRSPGGGASAAGGCARRACTQGTGPSPGPPSLPTVPAWLLPHHASYLGFSFGEGKSSLIRG